MTIGERIAQKRKELGLSQEALGERMGVSRQSIYKWESDAALPEIEKLVKLGREFGVSVGWLLGEEDEPEKRELTPEQLAMVEEIVGRYLNARRAEEAPASEAGQVPPDEEAPKQKRLRWLRAVSAGLILLGAIATAANLSSRLDRVTQNYNNLQNSVNNISYDVHSQIGSIAGRVEEVLQRQNTLTAEQSAEVISTDYRTGTVTLSARALPRTFTEGMAAEFILESNGESFTVPGELGPDHAFTAELTVPLSDDIPVSVVLITGKQRQTQLLDEFFSLYSDSFPEIDLIPGDLWGSGSEVRQDATLHIEPEVLTGLQSLRLGLFRDQKLVAWYEQWDGKSDSNYSFHGDFENTLFFRLNEAQTLEPEHLYCQAAVIVDQYGRERVYPSLPVEYDAEENCTNFAEAEYVYPRGMDPAGWEY